jgi:hypothetical protein
MLPEVQPGTPKNSSAIHEIFVNSVVAAISRRLGINAGQVEEYFRMDSTTSRKFVKDQTGKPVTLI